MGLTIADIFQRASLVTVIICFACILIPAWNSDGLTYSLVSTSTCVNSVIVIDLVDCIICCDTGKTTFGQDSLCTAAYDETIRLFSSIYAYVIPFIPICISTILYRNHDICRSMLLRGRFLVLLLLYRTFFMYKYLDYLEREYLPTRKRLSYPMNCWYHEIRECKSKVEFDTSDHIVLFICHYMVPMYIELVVVMACYEYIEPPDSRSSSSSSSGGGGVRSISNKECSTSSSSSAHRSLPHHQQQQHQQQQQQHQQSKKAMTTLGRGMHIHPKLKSEVNISRLNHAAGGTPERLPLPSRLSTCTNSNKRRGAAGSSSKHMGKLGSGSGSGGRTSEQLGTAAMRLLAQQQRQKKLWIQETTGVPAESQEEEEGEGGIELHLLDLDLEMDPESQCLHRSSSLTGAGAGGGVGTGDAGIQSSNSLLIEEDPVPLDFVDSIHDDSDSNSNSNSNSDTQSNSSGASLASLRIEDTPGSGEDISSPPSRQFQSLDLMVATYHYLRNIRLWVMILASLAFALVSLRAIAYTSSYFHTIWESLAALIQCVVLVILPLYCFSIYDKHGFYYYVLGIEIAHEY